MPQRTLTHIDQSGNASMVDVSAKPDTERIAVAIGSVAMQPETLRLVADNAFDKGDVLAVAASQSDNLAIDKGYESQTPF